MQGARRFYASERLMLRPVDAPRRRLSNVIHYLLGHEAARIRSQGNAKLKEFVHAHLSLPIEHIPEAFLVNVGATRQLGDAHPPC